MSHFLKLLHVAELADIVVCQIDHLQDADLSDFFERLHRNYPVVAQIKSLQGLDHVAEADNLRDLVARQVEFLKVVQVFNATHGQYAIGGGVQFF